MVEREGGAVRQQKEFITRPLYLDNSATVRVDTSEVMKSYYSKTVGVCVLLGFCAVFLLQNHVKDRYQLRILSTGCAIGIGMITFANYTCEGRMVSILCMSIWLAQLLSIVAHRLIPSWKEKEMSSVRVMNEERDKSSVI